MTILFHTHIYYVWIMWEKEMNTNIKNNEVPYLENIHANSLGD